MDRLIPYAIDMKAVNGYCLSRTQVKGDLAPLHKGEAGAKRKFVYSRHKIGFLLCCHAPHGEAVIPRVEVYALFVADNA
jgi:hypothetical protein